LLVVVLTRTNLKDYRKGVAGKSGCDFGGAGCGLFWESSAWKRTCGLHGKCRLIEYNCQCRLDHVWQRVLGGPRTTAYWQRLSRALRQRPDLSDLGSVA
jgi:hypothetical protein